MEKNKYIVIIYVSMFIVLLAGCGTQVTNSDYIDETVENIITMQDGEVELADITTFEWDAVYIFKPYTSQNGVKEAMGVKPKVYRTTASETDTLLYFLKEQEVVCCIAGTLKDLGFSVNYNFENYYDKLDNSAIIKMNVTDDVKTGEITQ